MAKDSRIEGFERGSIEARMREKIRSVIEVLVDEELEREWQSEAIPRYQRRTSRVDEAILGLYLSGANTRRIQGALAPLLREGPLSKDAVCAWWGGWRRSSGPGASGSTESSAVAPRPRPACRAATRSCSCSSASPQRRGQAADH
jgi:hypothetical protein